MSYEELKIKGILRLFQMLFIRLQMSWVLVINGGIRL